MTESTLKDLYPEIEVINEKHLWTSDQKLKFLGYGEWIEELDQVEFLYKGYKCEIIRSFREDLYTEQEYWFGGYLCGYIQIPETHPYFEDKEASNELECHGGITFNEIGEHKIRKLHARIVGFDCVHSGDLHPSLNFIENAIPELRKIKEQRIKMRKEFGSQFFNEQYRNMDYCIQECKRIVDQLEKVKDGND